MMPASQVIRQINAVLAIMFGDRSAAERLDDSPAGFWDSFLAMAYATPFLAIGWFGVIRDSDGVLGPANLPRFAFLDLVSWIVPPILVLRLARALDIEERVSRFIVAYNWSGLLFVILFAPVTFLFSGSAAQGPASSLFLALFLMVMVLSWRVQDAALDRGGRITFICFGLTLISGILVSATLQNWLGLSVPLDLQ